jgi:hypothetical protein
MPLHPTSSLQPNRPYMAFTEPLTISPMEALSFDSKQFMNNTNNNVIEAKTTNHFLLLEEQSIATVLLYKKYEVQFESVSHEVLKFVSKP